MLTNALNQACKKETLHARFSPAGDEQGYADIAAPGFSL